MNKLWLAIPLLTLSSVLPAASVTVAVTGQDGAALPFAVAYVLPQGVSSDAPVPANGVVVDQRDREFVPYVTVVRAGTAINFPNQDNIRHQVYSFSTAKHFELPLYEGNPHSPVLFDRPGVVPLGCNIHDWMSAYVFVAETPWYAVTDAAGAARLEALPAGTYQIAVWHPTLKGEPQALAQTLTIGGNDAPSLSFRIEQKRVFKPWRAPNALKTGGY